MTVYICVRCALVLYWGYVDNAMQFTFRISTYWYLEGETSLYFTILWFLKTSNIIHTLTFKSGNNVLMWKKHFPNGIEVNYLKSLILTYRQCADIK